VPFDRLVAQAMAQGPYRAAPRAFWVVDNGSSHRGEAAAARLQGQFPNLILVHLPTHASWLIQVEIVFSIVQRTVLTPTDFPDLAAVEQRLLDCETRSNDTATPFHWRFTRQHLDDRLAALPDRPPPRAAPPPPLPPTVTATLRAA
jgi:DDE superfamily endonuclease